MLQRFGSVSARLFLGFKLLNENYQYHLSSVAFLWFSVLVVNARMIAPGSRRCQTWTQLVLPQGLFRLLQRCDVLLCEQAQVSVKRSPRNDLKDVRGTG